MLSMLSMSTGVEKACIEAAEKAIHSILDRGRSKEEGFGEQVIDTALKTLGRMAPDNISTVLSHNTLTSYGEQE